MFVPLITLYCVSVPLAILFDSEVGMSLRSFSLNGEYDLIPAEGHQPYLDPMREDEAKGRGFPSLSKGNVYECGIIVYMSV